MERRMPAASRPCAARCSARCRSAAARHRGRRGRAAGTAGRRARPRRRPTTCPPDRARRGRCRCPRGLAEAGASKGGRREVGDGHVEVCGRGQHGVERRADREHDGGPSIPAQRRLRPPPVDGLRAFVSSVSPDVDAVALRAARRRTRARARRCGRGRGSSTREAPRQRDVRGRLVRAAAVRGVVGRAGGDEDGAEPWWPRSSLTCSYGRSTRNGAYECATGR